MIIYALLAIAAVVALWPSSGPSKGRGYLTTLVKERPSESPSATYMDAVGSLQTVRSRLAFTGHLDDDQIDAVNTLTLALVAGSEHQ